MKRFSVFVPISRALLHCFIRAGVIPLLLVTLTVPELLVARVVESWTYQQLFDKADLVIIAEVISAKDTDEHDTLLDLRVIGVTTEFKVHLILKGPQDVTTFKLHHYRFQSKKDEFVPDGPILVEITPRYHQQFLLFLIKERDGRYAPVGGQTDPALLSVLELRSRAD